MLGLNLYATCFREVPRRLSAATVSIAIIVFVSSLIETSDLYVGEMEVDIEE